MIAANVMSSQSNTGPISTLFFEWATSVSSGADFYWVESDIPPPASCDFEYTAECTVNLFFTCTAWQQNYMSPVLGADFLALNAYNLVDPGTIANALFDVRNRLREENMCFVSAQLT